MNKNIILLSCVVLLPGCSPEKNFQGVPEPTWKHLTKEQKQLIIKQAFQNEMKNNECDD